MNVRLFLCVTIVSGVIGSNGYAAAATADAYATKAPEYFTTRTYGPVHDGQLSGRGHKTTRVNVDLYGQALGKLFSRDDAERSDSSTKVIGYHLKHTDGRSYVKPRIAYETHHYEPLPAYTSYAHPVTDAYSHAPRTHYGSDPARVQPATGTHSYAPRVRYTSNAARLQPATDAYSYAPRVRYGSNSARVQPATDAYSYAPRVRYGNNAARVQPATDAYDPRVRSGSDAPRALPVRSYLDSSYGADDHTVRESRLPSADAARNYRDPARSGYGANYGSRGYSVRSEHEGRMVDGRCTCA